MKFEEDSDAAFASRSSRFGSARKKKRRVRAIILSVVAALLIATMGAGFYVFDLQRQFNSKSGKVSLDLTSQQEQARPVKDPEDGSLNFLLVGVDHADGEAPSENAFQGAVGQRSDSMMLVHIPEDRSQIYVMSLVRDMYVDVPGHGKNKLNSAVSLGGIPLLLQTVEGLFDTKIDHLAMIDFEGFRELSTALGGVTVQNDIPFTAHNTDDFYPAGKVTLEGDRALRFVRERKSFANGDYQRVANQRRFIAAAAGQLLSRSTLTNPVKLYEIVDKISPYLTFDDGFDAATIVGLGRELSNVNPSGMKMFTVPTAGTSTTSDGQSVELPSELAISQIADALQKDSMKQYLVEHPPEGQ